MDDSNRYLRKLGVFRCTIKKVGTKPAKGKYEEKFSITFESEDGRLIDQDYGLSKLKATDESKGGVFAKKQLKEIMEICAVKKPSELVGKSIAVLVAPNFWQGKGPFWNPRGFYDAKYLLGEEAHLEQVLGDMDNLLGNGGSDEILF